MDKKMERVMDLLVQMLTGKIVNKKEFADSYGKNVKTIERDFAIIRNHFADHYDNEFSLVYDRSVNGYRIKRANFEELTNSEIYAVIKILLESRSMTKSEMFPILDKMVKKCVPTAEYKKVEVLISNEKFHYLEPHHKKVFVKNMWDIATSVYESKLLELLYEKPGKIQPVKRTLRPVGIMFSEYYFYLIAFIQHGEDLAELPDSDIPTIYRMDRIRGYQILDDHFHVPYADRFEEGEFRKRIQFMTPGPLRIIKFRCKERSLEAILDKLPTAEILDSDENGYLIQAEVFGNGIDRWILSQGNDIEMIE